MGSSVGLIGGLAIPKQERLLSRHPELMIGTPGRIWYFMENHQLQSSSFKNIRFIVCDEADKLVFTHFSFDIDYSGSISGNEVHH